MNILEKINNDVIMAMKSGDKSMLSTLRMAKNAIQMDKIKLNHELSNEEIITTLKRQVKQKEDSIVEYTKYNKMDTVEELKKEIAIIKAYLPEELSIDDINKGLGNANKILNRYLWTVNKETDLRISKIDGGNLRKRAW